MHIGGLRDVAARGVSYPRTTTPIEPPFAAVRLRIAAAKRFRRVESATAVIWKTLPVAERTFRRLDGPELLAEVAEGATYVTRVRVKPRLATADDKAAPWTHLHTS